MVKASIPNAIETIIIIPTAATGVVAQGANYPNNKNPSVPTRVANIGIYAMTAAGALSEINMNNGAISKLSMSASGASVVLVGANLIKKDGDFQGLTVGDLSTVVGAGGTIAAATAQGTAIAAIGSGVAVAALVFGVGYTFYELNGGEYTIGDLIDWVTGGSKPPTDTITTITYEEFKRLAAPLYRDAGADGIPEDLLKPVYAEPDSANIPKDLLIPLHVDPYGVLFDGQQVERDIQWLEDTFVDWRNLNRSGFHYFYDPLVLDLNGNGRIDTLGIDINNRSNNAFFDFDADGLKHATGWLSGDDGFLVRDVNGDGIINDGTEVFGDRTRKADGSVAQHGFDALADLDSNGDGMISELDSLFHSLRIWQDSNANGISEADELKSLSDFNITSLNIDYKNTQQSLAGNNRLSQLGSYTRDDGSQGVMGDVDFSFNSMYTQHSHAVDVDDDSITLANLGGIGRLRSLHEAMAGSASLRQAVRDYMAADNHTAQMAQMDKLLLEWAKTDPEYQAYTGGLFDSISSPNNTTGAVGFTPAQGMRLSSAEDEDAQTDFMNQRFKIGILDSITGTRTPRLHRVGTRDLIAMNNSIRKSYDKIVQHAYAGLYAQTANFKQLLALVDVGLGMNDTGVEVLLDFKRLNNHIHTQMPLDTPENFGRMVEFLSYLNSAPNYQSMKAVNLELVLSTLDQAMSQLPNGTVDTWLESHVSKHILQQGALRMGSDQDDRINNTRIALAGRVMTPSQALPIATPYSVAQGMIL